MLEKLEREGRLEEGQGRSPQVLWSQAVHGSLGHRAGSSLYLEGKERP